MTRRRGSQKATASEAHSSAGPGEQDAQPGSRRDRNVTHASNPSKRDHEITDARLSPGRSRAASTRPDPRRRRSPRARWSSASAGPGRAVTPASAALPSRPACHRDPCRAGTGASSSALPPSVVTRIRAARPVRPRMDQVAVEVARLVDAQHAARAPERPSRRKVTSVSSARGRPSRPELGVEGVEPHRGREARTRHVEQRLVAGKERERRLGAEGGADRRAEHDHHQRQVARLGRRTATSRAALRGSPSGRPASSRRPVAASGQRGERSTSATDAASSGGLESRRRPEPATGPGRRHSRHVAGARTATAATAAEASAPRRMRTAGRPAAPARRAGARRRGSRCRRRASRAAASGASPSDPQEPLGGAPTSRSPGAPAPASPRGATRPSGRGPRPTRSATRSSASSRPIETRTVPGDRPAPASVRIGQLAVRGAGRMADEGLHAAEARGVDRRPARARGSARRAVAPAGKLEGQHATGHAAAQDATGELVLRVRLEPGIAHAHDAGRALERPRARPARSTNGAPCAVRASSARAARETPPMATRCRRR